MGWNPVENRISLVSIFIMFRLGFIEGWFPPIIPKPLCILTGSGKVKLVGLKLFDEGSLLFA
jgi:membrane protein YqaA with SNARE-associated domain